MPQEDLDQIAMEKQIAKDYWSIPSQPSSWTGTIAFCDEHVVLRLQQYIEQRKYWFLTFRFPDLSEYGYYW